MPTSPFVQSASRQRPSRKSALSNHFNPALLRLAQAGGCRLAYGCLAIALPLLASASPLLAEQWTNLAGTKTIEAEFVGMWDGKVILEKADGTRLSVPKDQLQALSRLRVEELVAERTKQLEQRIAELRQEPTENAPIPPAEATAPYQPWPESADPQATLRHIAEQLQAGHPRVLWDALPANYQQDIQGIVRLYAEKVDPQQYNTSMRLGSQLARVLHKQREFIFGYPQVAALPPEMLEVIRSVFTPAVGILAELSDAQTLSLENLRTADLSAIIAQKDESMGGYVAQLIALGGEQAGPLQAALAGEVEIKMEGPDRASVTLPAAAAAPAATGAGSPTAPSSQGLMSPGAGPGLMSPGAGPGLAPGGGLNPGRPAPPSLVLVRVDGRWLPEDMVKGWQQGVAETRKQLEETAEQNSAAGAQLASVALVVEPLLTRLEAATTQEEFNAVIDPYVNLVRGMLSQGSATGSGGYGSPGGYGSSGGYGSPGGYGEPGMEMSGEPSVSTEMMVPTE